MRKAVVMDPKDNVATALQDLKKGETVATEVGDQKVEVKLLEDIQFGHKFALRDIKASEHVHKYGEVIGAATEVIKKGAHVHVHNVEGLRGRGDKK